MLLGMGCAAMPPVQSTAAAREPRTIEEAQAELDRSEARLQTSPAGAPAPAAPQSSGHGDTAAPPPPPPPVAEPAKDMRPMELKKAEDAAPACTEVCRALSSMKRAADTICRLTSPDDTRCQSARRRVHDGEERASPCGCH